MVVVVGVRRKWELEVGCGVGFCCLRLVVLCMFFCCSVIVSCIGVLWRSCGNFGEILLRNFIGRFYVLVYFFGIILM